jgi:ribosomal protein L7/L12
MMQMMQMMQQNQSAPQENTQEKKVVEVKKEEKEEEKVEKTHFNIKVVKIDDTKKIALIKEVRKLDPSLGIKQVFSFFFNKNRQKI